MDIIILWFMLNGAPMSNYNNPANIEIGQGYAGETGETYAGRFAIFDSPVMGLRALFRDLSTKIERHSGDVRKIISQFAPDVENPTNNYVRYVESRVKKSVVTNDDLPILGAAVVEFENGVSSDRARMYLQPEVINEAYLLSQQNLPTGTRYKDVKPMSLQEGIQRYNKGDRIKQVPRQLPR